MKKVAVFLEGHTELIFVHSLIMQHFEYNVDIECNQLYTQGNIIETTSAYDFKVENASTHFRLICVGNDNGVLKAILDRETFLYKNGYSHIVGLRDMYSEDYREESDTVDLAIIRKFFSSTKATVKHRAQRPGAIHFCYAIMEIEAWMIALNIFEKINAKLTSLEVRKVLGFEASSDNIEKLLFKPSSAFAKIYAAAKISYDKSHASVHSFCSQFGPSDISLLLKSQQCRSFCYFHSKLFE